MGASSSWVTCCCRLHGRTRSTVPIRSVHRQALDPVVTELVVPASRSIAFGWLALVRGFGLLAAGAALGLAYDQSMTLAIWLILAVNAVALIALVAVLARLRVSS